MAADKPVIHVWPLNPDIKAGEGFTMDIQLSEGADYNCNIVSTSLLSYNKQQKRLAATANRQASGITAIFTPTKNGVNGDPVTVTVNIIPASSNINMDTYKPVITLLDNMPITVPVNTTQPVNMVVQPANATITKNDKRADVVTYDIASKSISTKGVVTQGTQYAAAWIDLTPSVRIGTQDVRGDIASIGVTTVAATQGVTTELTLGAESGQVTIGTPVEVSVTTNAADFSVESKNTDKANVAKGQGKFTITGVAAGQAVIEVKATAQGGAEVMKQYTATVVAAQQPNPPAGDKPTITIDPTTVNIQRGGTQVLNITLSEGADYNAVVASPANIGYDKATKTITGKNVMQGGQITFTPTKNNVNGDPVIVTVNISEQSGGGEGGGQGGGEGGNQGGGQTQPPVPPVVNPSTVLQVTPQVVVMKNKETTTFSVTNGGDNLQVEFEPADAFTWAAGTNTLTANRTGQYPIRFVKSADEVVVVNVTVGPEASVWDKFQNFSEVRALLDNNQIAPKDKFDQLDNSVSQCGSVVQSLTAYNNKMNPKVPNIVPKNGAAQNYNLLNQLLYIVSLDNKEEFTIQFDIVNLFFKEYKSEAYNEHLMQRFDNYWTWDMKALTTYQNLATCICMLCDIATRAENLKKISLDKVLDPLTTILTPTAIANIKSYYIP